ncbi:uncharacterized protein ARMOST_22513 [Armillaria ostoyae]|uniref:Uncharacterized protein n=1 Tax=Armillaria ostoyae TaxID=47428 RepID=A0A284SD34_ARMOS|nr:uncharacterized protein ARMOST_22513 [Armillaria ostoyae]
MPGGRPRIYFTDEERKAANRQHQQRYATVHRPIINLRKRNRRRTKQKHGADAEDPQPDVSQELSREITSGEIPAVAESVEPPSFSQKHLNRITALFADYRMLAPLPLRDFLDHLVSDALECQGMQPYHQIDAFHDRFTDILKAARRAEGRLYRCDGAGDLFQQGASMPRKQHYFKYTKDQLRFIKFNAYSHGQYEARGQPAELDAFLDRFFLEWDLLYPENLTGDALQARRRARKLDLVKMLRWAYWIFLVPALRRVEAKKRARLAAEQAAAARKARRLELRDAQERVRVQREGAAYRAKASAKYKTANPAYTRVKGDRGRAIVGPFSVGYEDMLERENAERGGAMAGQADVDSGDAAEGSQSISGE